MQEESTTQLAEVLYLISKLEQATLPQGLREQIEMKLKRLRRMARQGQSAGEYEAIAKYIDWCMSVPWGRYVQDNLDLVKAKQVIDSMHYGSENVKEVVLEYLAVLNRKNAAADREYSAPVLAFVGVQGAGKTSLAKAIAAALGRPFYRISLGGLGSPTELRGSPAADLTGTPGQIVRSMVKSGCMNPVILLDEFDKVSGSESSRQDFMAIMLEIMDPQQNKSFRDIYIDYPVDLSKILFIATANRFKTISRELLDRIEFIEFPDYTVDEKVVIAQKYLFPKVLEYAELKPEELQISQTAWPKLISTFGTDQGVRRIEQSMKKLARYVTKQIVLGKTTSVTIDESNVDQYARLVLPSVEEVRNKDFTAAPTTAPDATSNSVPDAAQTDAMPIQAAPMA
ncbi:MAG: AAA family ATPase [Candidatus Dojkabacteria bacterium]|nr:MAG: AAA family ATPase [Candidatus Dojkabacteria bacterium]